MSGLPATPAASRAAPGAPRVLVYVADRHRLETELPTYARDTEDAVLYKTVNENGSPYHESLRTDFFAGSGPFGKNLKLEDGIVDKDSANYHNQMRCPSLQPGALDVGRGVFLSDNVRSVSENNKDLVDNESVSGLSVSEQVSAGVGVAGELHIAVPLGWRRILSGTSVLYISPSGTALGTLSQLREYLQTTGTCKCGLPCPLRPENTFSFDPKVASKPYQTPTGAELAKLCNHKRKLLATLNVRTNATPPPQPDKKGGDMAVLVKKVKRHASHMTNQLIIQKEKSITEYKAYQQQQQLQQQQQDVGEQIRTASPVVQMRINSQSCPPAFNTSQQLTNIVSVTETNEHKNDFQIQRTSSHYLTVNSGWIQPEATQKLTNIAQGNANLGQPVLSSNGQVIGLNTTGVKGLKNIHHVELEQKEDNKMLENCNQTMKNKEEESHVFCGLNQPLTPEVMQKINEQQQIFIQQNQKQIEMAMKVYRPQIQENTNTNQGKPQCQRNFMAPGQLFIQNGAVMKTNPGKMPPWQVKNQAIHNTKTQRTEDMEYEETSINTAEDALGRGNNIQPMCSRVPPLPQHYSTLTVQQWPSEPPKKKSKSKGKKNKHAEKNFGNNGIRILEDTKIKAADQCNNPIPSFMDDPNGYLAQQTVLLNNTISRQVGINNTYEQGVFDNPSANYTGVQNEFDKNIKTNTKINEVQYRNNLVQNSSPSPNRTPDSSVVPDKMSDPTHCTKGCNPTAKITCAEHYQQNVMRKNNARQNFETTDFSGNPSFPNKNIEESPVTSSTLMDREEVAGQENQMMHFISNHNINKNFMDIDNQHYLGNRKRVNSMPGYCPPPHLGGGAAATLVQASYIQSYGSTLASGLSVTRNTFTSVLAGRARTSTTSINASTPNFIRPPPPPSVDLATSYAIPTNRPDPFINSVNLPTSYPLHIAGTTAQNMISKSPLEMMQNVIGNSTGKNDVQIEKKANNPSQILISSTKQIVISSGTPMPPPPPKSTSSGVLLNTLPAPFVLPSVMVDGQVVPQLVTSPRQMQGVALLSPENVTKKSKKKKAHATNATNMLQITANQQNNNIVVHHTSPQHNTSPQFSPRGFQLSPNNNLNSAPMLQALTIVPGKTGTPHIVMQGQGTPNNFGSQQIISNTSPSQQINLLQPVNLLNNTAGVVSNFPAFQQFIVPNIGGMVMTADGTIIQDNSTGVQLQLQTVNGQNVLTPVQNFPAANTGVVIRAQNQQGKLVSQFSPNFNGNLSPLLANLSPNSLGGYSNDLALSPRGRTVSTQTFGQARGGVSPSKSPGGQAGCSPPDTTTLSPLGPLEASPRRGQPLADTTTKSPEPHDCNSLAMVQCVSSSEQDMPEQSDHSAWSAMPVEFPPENDTQSTMSNMQIVRNNRGYNQTISVTSVNNQHSLTITPGGYYERGVKRKLDPLDSQNKIPRPTYPLPPATLPEYEPQINYDQPNFDQNPTFPPLDRNNDSSAKFAVGEVVWAPHGGHPWWPAQVVCGRDHKWEVRWFGPGRGVAVLPPRRLLSLTQGLDYYAAARAGRRKSRKLNIHLENAIQEAMAELDKTSEQSSEVSNPTPKSSSSEAPKKLTKKSGRSKILKKSKAGKIMPTNLGENTRLRNKNC